MNFPTERYELIRLNRRAIDRYSLQPALDIKLSAREEEIVQWTLTASHNINTVRAGGHDGAPPVVSGRLLGLIMLTEAYHRILSHYCQNIDSELFKESVDMLEEQQGEAFYRVLSVFLDNFPTAGIYRHAVGIHELLNHPQLSARYRQDTLESAFVTWLHDENPAIVTCRELLDADQLAEQTDWRQSIRLLCAFWNEKPEVNQSGMALADFLLEPMRQSPDSIEGQLRFIAEQWQNLMGDFSMILLKSADVIREETRPVFHGPGPARVPEFSLSTYEPEAFSPDVDWMPDVVMLAKNVYVWLDQLSTAYQQTIDRLDLIPDAELHRLSRRGFNALWLIGLWQRSDASQTIKRMCGNPEAMASAYSLADYRIAEDLGGDLSFQVLKERAWKHGIRMAGDMVPNHMGIDSWWLCQQPDWFVSTETSPYPQYTFNGVDLSPDPRCSIYLEDHYYDKTDAAVVFKYVDNWTGADRYIYHGNDGTDLPWNDTAQLNFLRKDVREQVIETILHVARQFPIIRFDAAMTLAKKHFQRLWFPEPGQGGDIATRSWFGMSKDAFDELIPEEFWREVVDRIARDAPDTLLLAEAFWLMEGYFVRSLGMHRVYNSAFMNMLRDEENAKYRSVIKNTIEFDPEVLRRYVNFMNNPDEEPAVIQFGKGDKYFGICAMMATLPGLPMFGHGQFEGYSEKYGMEYSRRYWDEQPDEGLIAHHERVITPILRCRRVFSGSEKFRLYDFYNHDDSVNENVFAYSNTDSEVAGLFIYNNAQHAASGVINESAAWRAKDTEKNSSLTRQPLAAALGLSGSSQRFVVFKDLMSRRFFIRRSSLLSEHGFAFDLAPYQSHTFIDIHEIDELEDGRYGQIETYLQGGGCRSLEDIWLDMQNQELYSACAALSTEQILQQFDEFTLIDTREAESDESIEPDTAHDLELRDLIDLDQFENDISQAVSDLSAKLQTLDSRFDSVSLQNRILDCIEENLLNLAAYRDQFPSRDRLIILWHGVLIQAIISTGSIPVATRIWRLMENDLIQEGMDEDLARSVARLNHELILDTNSQDYGVLFGTVDARRWLQVNHYDGVKYFNRESLDELLEWIALWHHPAQEFVESTREKAKLSGYQYEDFLDAVSGAK